MDADHPSTGVNFARRSTPVGDLSADPSAGIIYASIHWRLERSRRVAHNEIYVALGWRGVKLQTRLQTNATALLDTERYQVDLISAETVLNEAETTSPTPDNTAAIKLDDRFAGYGALLVDH